MSKLIREKHFKCVNDCVQTGCPGHIAKIIHHHTSDTVSIQIDNGKEHYFDEGAWSALWHLEKEMREE